MRPYKKSHVVEDTVPVSLTPDEAVRIRSAMVVAPTRVPAAKVLRQSARKGEVCVMQITLAELCATPDLR